MTSYRNTLIKAASLVCILSITSGCMSEKYGMPHPLSAEAFKQDIAIGAAVAVGVVAYKKAEELLSEDD